jgi:hypothetical protein
VLSDPHATGDLTCNQHTGLCEKPRQLCDSSQGQQVCVPPPESSDVVTKAAAGRTIWTAPPPPPLTGDAVRIVPAAEANPPSSK